MRGRTWRPISIRSRNPAVVIIATRPPVRWIKAFVAIVVPWAKWLISSEPMPCCLFAMASPSRIARDGSSGVDGTLWTTTSLVARLNRQKSVNVPPTSTPTTQLISSFSRVLSPLQRLECASKFPWAVTDRPQGAALLQNGICGAPRIATRRCRLALCVAVKAAIARAEVTALDAEGVLSRYGRVERAAAGDRQRGNQDPQHCSLTSLACINGTNIHPKALV